MNDLGKVMLARRRPRNPNGTFKRVSKRKPRSARSGKTRAPSAKAKPRSLLMNTLKRILHELREMLWPSDSEEMGIKRGYLDDRDRI